MSKRKTTPDIESGLPPMDDLLQGTPPAPQPEEKPDKGEREKIRQKKRAKYQARYDLPPGMKELIVEIADELETTASQVAAYLLADALHRYRTDRLDPANDRSPSRSPRNKYNLDIDFEP